ncbi:hypothetical protein LI137_09800, partial [Anaerostipes hadrus]
KCKRCRKILVCCFEGISFIYRFNNGIQSILRDKNVFFSLQEKFRKSLQVAMAFFVEAEDWM